jgi:hypothetical protein
VQVAEEVSREGEVTSSNPADRVTANFVRKMPRLRRRRAGAGLWAPPPIKKNSRVFFHIFLFRALPSVCRVPNKRLSTKKPLPIGFSPMAFCQELHSAKALLRTLEALPRTSSRHRYRGSMYLFIRFVEVDPPRWLYVSLPRAEKRQIVSMEL